MKMLTLKNAFSLDEGVVMELSSVPGGEGCNCSIQSNSAVAALKGLALLTQELAKRMQWPVEHVLCQITTILLAPEIPEGTEPNG